MATFTNPSFSLSEPSAYETQLAARTGNPEAFALRLAAKMDREGAATQQADMGRLVLALQQRQAAAENQNNAAERVAGFLKLIGDNAGAATALTSNPIASGYLQGTDLSGAVASAQQQQQADVASKVMSGLGRAYGAGVLFDPEQIKAMTGVTATPGTNPMVAAAALRAGGDNSPKVTMTQPTPDSPAQISVSGKDATAVARTLAAAGGAAPPVLPRIGAPGAKQAMTPPAPSPALPQAQSEAPTAPAPAAKPVNMQQIQAALSRLTPQQRADVQAYAAQNNNRAVELGNGAIVFHGNDGRKYTIPLQ